MTKDVYGLWGDKTDVLEKKAMKIIYRAVSRALKNPQRLYPDNPRKAFEEGLSTVNTILSGVSRGTRKQVENDLIKPYKQKNSFD